MTVIEKIDQDLYQNVFDAIHANQLNLAHRMLLDALEANPENIQTLLLLSWTAPTAEAADFYIKQLLDRYPENPFIMEIVRSLSHKLTGEARNSKRNISETKALISKAIAHLESQVDASSSGVIKKEPVILHVAAVKPDSAEMQYEHMPVTRLAIAKNFGIALAYLAGLAIAEILTTLARPQIGLILHGVLLLVLILHAALFSQRAQQRFLMTLTLVPLIRLLSLSIPLLNFPPIYWYAVIGIPLLLAVFLVLRMTGFKASVIGMNVHALPWQLVVGMCGFGFGYLEYIILRPAPLIKALTWQQIWLPALILLVFTGFLEEIIFRGLVQRGAAGMLGRYGLIYVSVVFAVLHFGYRSILDVIFVFLVALFFGMVVARTGSLLGVTLAHGLTNIALYLIIPFLISPTTNPMADVHQSDMPTFSAPIIGAISDIASNASIPPYMEITASNSNPSVRSANPSQVSFTEHRLGYVLDVNCVLEQMEYFQNGSPNLLDAVALKLPSKEQCDYFLSVHRESSG